MSISVLIATYNRARLLETCLAQMARQAFEAGDEVVVVDNGSTDGTASVVEAAARISPAPVRYLVERTAGKSRALAAGIAASRGDVLAFTDDDVVVGSDWLQVIRETWLTSTPGLVGGPVRPRWECPAPAWLRVETETGYGPLAAPLALLDYGPDRQPLGGRTALGANMAVRRTALQAAGGFPRDLGKLRGTLLSGEDHLVCERVQAVGFTALYEPRMIVHHHVPRERLRLAYHVRWFFWSGITNAALDRRAGENAPPPGRPSSRHWLGRIARGAGRAAVAACMGRLQSCGEGLVDVAFALGYLAFARGWVGGHGWPASAVGQRSEAA